MQFFIFDSNIIFFSGDNQDSFNNNCITKDNININKETEKIFFSSFVLNVIMFISFSFIFVMIIYLFFRTELGFINSIPPLTLKQVILIYQNLKSIYDATAIKNLTWSQIIQIDEIIRKIEEVFKWINQGKISKNNQAYLKYILQLCEKLKDILIK